MARIFLLLISALLLIACADDDPGPAPLPRDKEIVGIINDVVNDQPIVLYANAGKRLMVAFKRENTASTEQLDITASDSGFPVVFKDQHGNEYDIAGNMIGSEEVSLKPVNQVVGYWFFFPSFFASTVLYNGDLITNSNYSEPSQEWLIDTKFIYSGSFRDGIPSIDNPKLKRLEGKALIEDPFYSQLGNDELVIVISSQGENYIYPHRILEYHEVVNAEIGDQSIAISYCPLTGTSKAWNRNIFGNEVEFGVSGLLYNNNLIMYDRTSETLWSQILSIGINGDYISQRAEELTVIETTIGEVQSITGLNNYLTDDTGFSFDYSETVYDNYKTDNRVSFPLTFRDDRFHPKERVLGIPFENDVMIYRFEDFQSE